MSFRGASARLALCAALTVAVVAVAGSAAAEVELGTLVRRGMTTLPRAFGSRVPSVVEVPAGSTRPPGFVRIGRVPSGAELGVVEVKASSVPALVQAFPDVSFGWSPPLRPLLDRAGEWNGLGPFRRATKLTGRGVVLGIVDTGVDPTHADLRDANGKSRILYWLDFSRGRANLHPELENALGCSADANDENGTPCAVYTGADVDDLVSDADPRNDPTDFGGHGTHVASLAGGTGLASDPVRYVGMAPEATFIVARVARKGGGIYDADVLKAASFVFERAAELNQPAVVNLSLGTDFGAHDGSSPIERGLESLVGDAFPGRAIVVAAGNSAGLIVGADTGAPEPLGVHTEVHVAEGSSTLVPLLTPPTSPGVTQGTIYVWLTLRPGDRLGLGVERVAGAVIEPIPPGHQAIADDGEVEVTIINGVTNGSGIPLGSYGAAVVIDGRFSSQDVFGLRLEGPASAELWVEGDNELGPERSIGPLLPRAQKEGTINLPACSPGLIAVGATVNRTQWKDYLGEDVTMPAYAGGDVPVDSAAFFSAAGPNALGVMKPDLAAPGANIIGAMAKVADPRDASTPAGGIFDDLGSCAVAGYAADCFVIDDAHALTGGTSMSAPLVTGAVALLFERDPTLTQPAARALLQAGARRISGVAVDARQVGAGALDLERTLEALDEGAVERLPGAATTLVVSSSYVHPDPTWPLEALLELRDDADHIADGFDSRRLSFDLTGGTFLERPLRIAPGLWRFTVTAPAESGGTTLTLGARFDGRLLAHQTLPIAVDHALSTTVPSARGGCVLAPARTASSFPFAPLLLAAAFLHRRRRTSNAHPPAPRARAETP
jgi:subtilisin family serine protease